MLTDEHIQTFHRDGVVVIENVLTSEEVATARNGLHRELLSSGIDHDAILSGASEFKEGIRIKSKAGSIFYGKWKMDVHLHPTVYTTMRQLFDATFFSDNPLYKCPAYLHERDIGAYIDRVAWRLPDHVCAEGGLALHLDRNPFKPYSDHLLKWLGGNRPHRQISLSNERDMKWRPIQAFVTLTDHYGSDSGGLRVVKGFHHRIDDFFRNGDPTSAPIKEFSTRKMSSSSNHFNVANSQHFKGEFFRMHGKSYAAVEKQLQPIDAPAGSLVCWDNRLPHATADHLVSHDTREVVFTGWLPKTGLNMNYMQSQLKNIELNLAPPAYKQDDIPVDRDWKWTDLTPLQRKLLGYSG